MTDDVEEVDGCTIDKETPKAVLVVLPTKAKIWVPKKVISDDSEIWADRDVARGPGKLVVARWFAEKEGIG